MTECKYTVLPLDTTPHIFLLSLKISEERFWTFITVDK